MSPPPTTRPRARGAGWRRRRRAQVRCSRTRAPCRPPGDAGLGPRRPGIRSANEPVAAAAALACRREAARGLDRPRADRLGRRLLPGDAFSDGVAYNPAANTWRKLPRSPLGGSQHPTGAWTGHELVIFVSGLDPDGKRWPGRLARAAAYNPATNTWPGSRRCPRSARAQPRCGTDARCSSSAETGSPTELIPPRRRGSGSPSTRRRTAGGDWPR